MVRDYKQWAIGNYNNKIWAQVVKSGHMGLYEKHMGLYIKNTLHIILSPPDRHALDLMYYIIIITFFFFILHCFSNLGVTTGSKSYYFFGDFAGLQDALVEYTIDVLQTEVRTI